MKRRDFLGAIGGSFALSISGFDLGATAQERYASRTIYETAAERLRQVYSYIPNTPEYEALAVGDALWSDISKQFDAFGYGDSRADYFDGDGRGYLGWLTVGPDLTGTWSEPGLHVSVPPLAADQILQLGEHGYPSTLTLFTGIDAAIPASIFQEKGYVATSFAGGAIYIHADQAVIKRITWNRFAVLLDEGVLIWFDSEVSAQQYVSWIVEGGSSLADSVAVGRKLALVEPDAITCAWQDGAWLNLDGSVRKVLGDYAANESVEAYREQMLPTFRQQEQLFGRMPQILTLMVGCDAGASPEPEALVPGFNVPRADVKLQFGSYSDAYLAAEIIEWRMMNAPSFVTREIIDVELFQPLPIDPAEVHDGILIQRFDEPYRAAHKVVGMMRQFDLSIYGWGEFS